MTLEQLQEKHTHALNAAESIISAHEKLKTPLTPYAKQNLDRHIKEAGDLLEKITAAKATPTGTRSTEEARAFFAKQPRLPNIERVQHGSGREVMIPERFSRDYLEAFRAWHSGGVLTASLQEGVSMFGGYAVPVTVDGNVVPLSPQNSTIRRLSRVIATEADLRVPQVTVRAGVTAKSETSAFTVAAPVLGQFTLSAFMAGVEIETALEFFQDVRGFNSFILEAAVSDFLEYEESLFLTGTGSGQPQGLIGNVGAGITAEPDGNGNNVTTAGIRSLIGTLKESYALNASFVMTKGTSLVIRASQTQSGLYEPAFTRVGNQDFLFGYPVAYSAQMPSASRNNTAVLFGDFARGYLIGDRGGSALLLKILDQAGAAQGLVNLLFSRRTDGRVRDQNAIQGLTISAS